MREDGIVMVGMAMGLIVFIAGLAFLVDFGLVYLNRAQLSAATDAAALAGVHYLPFDQQASENVAHSFYQRNGRAGDEVEVEIEGNVLTVRAYRNLATFFAPVLGVKTMKVMGESAATISSISRLQGAVPFGMVRQNFVYGALYSLRYGPESPGGSYRGNFGPLALGGTGGSTYEHNIRHGYSGWIQAGSWVKTETGNMAGPTRRAVRERLDGDPFATYQTVTAESSRFLMVPIVSSMQANGRGEVWLEGFAAFFLEGFADDNTGTWIMGRFLHWLVDAPGGAEVDFGLRSSRLIR